MDCCNECQDHLLIPEGAIKEGEEYVITQIFPLLCHNTKLSSNFKTVCIKEYQEIKDRPFQIHVTIVANFTTDLDPQQIRVRYSKLNKTYNYEEAVLLKSTHEIQKPEVYFQILDKRVMIFTKHFTRFKIEQETESRNGILEYFRFNSRLNPTCPAHREVNLVVSAYFGVNVKKQSVILNVYMRDILQNNNSELKMFTHHKEAEVDGKQNYMEDKPFINLPDVITVGMTFQCIAIFHVLKWKRLITTLVRIQFINDLY